jgi:predicted permease
MSMRERTAFAADIFQDLQYGIRWLQRSPIFTAAVVLTLAVGIGANTAVFSFIDSLLVEKLTVPHPEQLFHFVRVTSGERGESFSYPEFLALRGQRAGLGEAFGYAFRTARVQSGVRQEDVFVELASTGYFSVLGSRPAEGRTFDDLGPSDVSVRVAVISDRFWERRFARSEAALGSTLNLNGTVFTIVGIMPGGFRGVSLDYPADVWIPLSNEPEIDKTSLLANSSPIHWVRVMTRIDSHVFERQVASKATALIHASALAQDPQKTWVDLIPASRPESGLRAALTSPLLLLFGIVGLLLLVACVNVAHLLQARFASRRQEFWLRMSLGAGRGRLVRQLAAEISLLAAAGAVAAIFAAWAATAGLVRLLSERAISPIPFPETLRFHPNVHVVVFTAIVAASVNILFTLLPALRTIADPTTTPKADIGRQRPSLLLVTQMALSLLLLIVAGLLIRSFQRLSEADLGFSATDVVQLQIDWRSTSYSDEQVRRLSSLLLDEFRALPGVSGASMAVPGMFSRSTWQTSFRMTNDPNRQAIVQVTSTAPDLFRTLEIPVLRGRDFTSADRANSPPVVILSDNLARTYFPHSDPVGAYVFVQGAAQPAEVIGVVGDVKLRSVLGAVSSLIYVPFAQSKGPVTREVSWQVRCSTCDVASMFRAARRVIPAADVTAQPLVDTITQSIMLQRLAAWLTGLFGLLGLALAVIGMYGLLSYIVVQRTSEMGIRLALGARQRDLLWLIWHQAMQPVTAGMAVGLLLSVAVTRLLRSYLFGLSGADPVTIVGCLALMGVVAGLGCYLPARRAARVDPITALRCESAHR